MANAYSCKKPVVLPDTPQINFEKFTYADTSLTIKFVDGDGDIGVEENDTITKYNLFLEFYKVALDTSIIDFVFPPHIKIPYIPEPQGNNKTLEGIIRVNLSQSIPPIEKADSFYIKFWLQDRAKHSSNIDSTPLIKHLLFPKFVFP